MLLVADTHIGFDLPLRPRLERRRRGHDFLANYEGALASALDGSVDLVVHGGDLLDRANLPAAIAEMALRPLFDVAMAGVPVVLLPGNHDRSLIPNLLMTAHANMHVFNGPGTLDLRVRDMRVAVSAFPFDRRAGERFNELLRACSATAAADIRILCMHQAVEGAVVGPSNFTFRRGRGVVQGRQIPRGYAAVLSGHIHRSQLLRRDLSGRPLSAPVVYPGSVERTAFAERSEAKHYAVLEFAPDAARRGGKLTAVEFRELPTRPMFVVHLDPALGTEDALARYVEEEIAALPSDAVVQLRFGRTVGSRPSTEQGPLSGRPDAACRAVPARQTTAAPTLSASRLRQIAPPTMNVSLSYRHAPRSRGRRARLAAQQGE